MEPGRRQILRIRQASAGRSHLAMLAGLLLAGPLAAQSRAAVERERGALVEWLRTAPDSPLAPGAGDGVTPAWFEYDSGPVFLSAVRPAGQERVVAVIAPEGFYIRVTLMGTFTFSLGGAIHRAPVYRVPRAGAAPRYLIHLRDSTNGQTTHPAGRFVPLIPLGEGRYLLDLNRASNPHCAYSPAIRCPDPWPGEPLPTPVEVGERMPVAARLPAG